jgi:hypothetical protein
VILVIHPRKEEDNSELGLSSIGGTAKSSQESDLVMIIQKLGQQKYLQVLKNRYNGQLGKIPLVFDEYTSTFSSKEIGYRPPLLLPASVSESAALNDSNVNTLSLKKSQFTKKSGSNKERRKTVHNVADSQIVSHVDEDPEPCNNNHFDYYYEKSKEFLPESTLEDRGSFQDPQLQEKSKDDSEDFPETLPVKEKHSWKASVLTEKGNDRSNKLVTEKTADELPLSVEVTMVTAAVVSNGVVVPPVEKKSYKKRRTVKALHHVSENI